MKIELSKNDCLFIKYVLKQYATQTEGLDTEDKENIYEIANKF